MKLFCLIFSLCTLAACGNPQEEARIKLGQMNVKYNEDTFVDRAQDGDTLAVKLFLQAGMSPNVTEKDGVTPLIAAARAGRLEIVRATPGQGRGRER